MAELVVREGNGRQLRPKPRRDRFVVEGHDGDFVWHLDACLLKGLVGAHREPVVKANKSAGRRPALEQRRWHHQAWRDPWVFHWPDDDRHHVLITARSPHGEPDGAGVIGHARSRDLIDWEVLPPLTEPGEFAQLEVPQLVWSPQGYTILFSCHAGDHSRERMKRTGTDGQAGTFFLSAKDFCGPYLASDTPVAPFDADLGVLYAGKLLEDDAGHCQFMAFRGDQDGDFRGELAGPLAVEQATNGEMVVVTDQREDSSTSGLAPKVLMTKPGERLRPRPRWGP